MAGSISALELSQKLLDACVLGVWLWPLWGFVCFPPPTQGQQIALSRGGGGAESKASSPCLWAYCAGRTMLA